MGVTVNIVAVLVWSFYIVIIDGRIYRNPIHIYYNHDNTVYSKSYSILMHRSFGFLKNAELEFSMGCLHYLEPEGRPEMWLLLCSTSEAREFTRMSYNQINIECKQLSHEEDLGDTYCLRQLVNYNETSSQMQYSFYKTMDHSHFYTVILLQCPNYDIERSNVTSKVIHNCQSQLVAMNPGGEHLSSDEVSLPKIFTVIFFVWLTLYVIWTINCGFYFKYSNDLHRLLSVVPFLKVLLVLFTMLCWRQVATTGIESQDFTTLKYLLVSVENALLFMTLMVIAEGWGVIHCHFKHYKCTSLFMLFIVFCASLMCVYWLHKYFLALSICCVFFIMYRTLKMSSYNMHYLRRRRRKVRKFIGRHSLHCAGKASIDSQLFNKYLMYYRFRFVCGIFSVSYAIAFGLSIFLHEYEYIKALVFEIPELILFVAIGYIFRLRDFESYHNIELIHPKENVAVLELPEVCHNDVTVNVVLGLPEQLISSKSCKMVKETQSSKRKWKNRLLGSSSI